EVAGTVVACWPSDGLGTVYTPRSQAPSQYEYDEPLLPTSASVLTGYVGQHRPLANRRRDWCHPNASVRRCEEFRASVTARRYPDVDFAGEGPQGSPPQRPCRRSSPQGEAKQFERRSRRAPLNRLPRGSASNLPGAHLRFFFNGAQKAVVVELELPFLWTPALGIKCAIFRLNPLKALSGFRDRPSNGEIIRLAFDYKPVSPGWEYEVFILWLN